MAKNPTEEELYPDVVNMEFGPGAPTSLGGIDETSMGFARAGGLVTVYQPGSDGPGPGGGDDDLVVFIVTM